MKISCVGARVQARRETLAVIVRVVDALLRSTTSSKHVDRMTRVYVGAIIG